MYSVFFTLYTHSIDLHSRNFGLWNFVFDADQGRVTDVFTKDNFISDTNRHPLYTIFFKRITILLDSHLIHDAARSTLLVATGIGCLSIPVAFLIFLKLVRNEMDACLLTVIFGCSSSVWLLSSIPETFSMNLAMLVLAFYFQTRATDKGSQQWKNTFFQSFFAFIAAGITISNSVYVIFGFINNMRKRREKLVYIAFRLALFSVILLILMGIFTSLQRELYPSAIRLVSPSDYASIFTQDSCYFSFNPNVLQSINKILVLARTMFIDNLVAPRAVIKLINSFDMPWTIIGFETGGIYIILLLAYAVFFTAAIVKIVWEKAYHDKDIQLAASFVAFNLIFHYFYQAVGIPFLYSIHTVFSLIFLLAWFYKSLDFRFKRLVLLAAVIAVVANNSVFISRVNTFLNTDLAPIDHNIGNGRPAADQR